MSRSLFAFVSVTLAALAVSLSGPAANARPSFSCSGNLNRAEITICRDDNLGALDREMVASFNRAMRSIDRQAQRSLKRRQAAWRSVRDACGRDRICLRNAYIDQIARLRRVAGLGGPVPTPPSRDTPTDQLSSSSGTSTPPAPPSGASAKVLADGTLEYTTPDGQVRRRTPGGSVQTRRPDGSWTTLQLATTTTGGLPDLPPDADPWVDRLEGTLKTILTNILSPDELAAYEQTEAGKSGLELVEWRLGSIKFLTGSLL
ncbi:MAG: DUF1311 domain-containing protein [Rhodobiaceae bacterium]|nr:DUF1311 domain-containing protein [Rhodobiaceae bacterium]